MLESYYLADVSVARRAGVDAVRYFTGDGRVVVNDSDLRRIRLSAEEYVTGLGVEIIDQETAKRLIRENGYDLGGALTLARLSEADAPAAAAAGEEDPSSDAANNDVDNK